MTHPNPSTALGRVVIDELAACGVELVVIAPGSRSAALAIAAAESPLVETRVVIDERSAAFHALGVARATGRPCAVVATSGTAPANFLPAVVEADMSCVPLVAVSADRPADMQGVGANQTIDQVDLFGAKVRGFAAIEAPDHRSDGNVRWRETVRGLVTSALGPSPGPVHLNVAFREPTVPVADDGRTSAEVYPFGTPRLDAAVPSPQRRDADVLPSLISGRGVLIAGDGEYDREEVAKTAARLGWPVLATALSGLRGGAVVSSYQHLFHDGVPPELAPDLVVAVGAIGPSPALETLFAAGQRRVRVDRWGRHIDPGRNATDLLAADPLDLLDRVSGGPEPGWSEKWLIADRKCRVGLRDAVAAGTQMSGGAVAMALNEVSWENLVVASSLPIREVDAHLTRPGRVFANRGASGIDGFVSTALGIASRVPRTLALAGDLSLLHDSNGFLNDGSIDMTLVVVDNKGGGLFDSLPQASHAPGYERLFVTDPERDLAALAVFHQLRFALVEDMGSLIETANRAVDRGGIEMICVPVDRGYDLAVRSELGG